MLTNTIIVIVSVLIALIALWGGFFFYVYWFRIQRPVPDLTGLYTLPTLEAPVQVKRDKHGIPHIYAQSEADLYRAQGYVHAQDRLWQMEQSRRTAFGRLSEIFGEAALEADRFARIMGFGRAAEQELAALDAETLQVLSWYAEGVNAYLGNDPDRLAAEFNLLRFQPEPWSPLDTLAYSKTMSWALSINWESELTRMRLVQQMGPLRAMELEPDYPGSNPLTLEGVGSEEMTRMLSTAGLLLNQYEGIKAWLGTAGDGQGSNSWVLGPQKTMNELPLLCSDPHLSLQIPGVWYENHLHAPGINVSGVSFIGSPGVMIGHNEHVAWGITNGFADVQDLYMERPHADDPTRFAWGETWEQAEVIEETISIRKQAPHVEEVVITRHGPLITGLLATEPDADRLNLVPLAIRWAGHMPGNSMRAVYRLNHAQNWDEFQAAVADWDAAPQNFTYADVGGNIGYVLGGSIPQRDEQILGLVPTPGWTAQHEWPGMIAKHELPRLYNPASGMIVTANNKIIGDDYPYFLGIEFDPGWRAARIEELLTKKARHSARDMEEIQLDTGSSYAAELAPWLAMLNSNENWESIALRAIRNWNYRMDPDSEAALIFHYTLIHLLDMVYSDKIATGLRGFRGMAMSPLFLIHGFSLRAETRLLELINEHAESIWYMEAKTRRSRTREELLQEALSAAVRDIRKQISDNALKWDWGRSHQIRYVHALGSARFLRRFFNRGPFPIGGDGTTPMLARQAPELPPGLVQVLPSYRQIYEVGAWDRAQTVTTAGQSGHPLSDHYDDQIAMFCEGVYHPMPWSDDAVDEATVYLMTLSPDH